MNRELKRELYHDMVSCSKDKKNRWAWYNVARDLQNHYGRLIADYTVNGIQVPEGWKERYSNAKWICDWMAK